MPEEYRIWKDKIDAIEAKKKQVGDHGHSKSHAAAASERSSSAAASADSGAATTNTEKSRKQRFLFSDTTYTSFSSNN